MSKSRSREIIDRISKEPGIKYELTEFETLGKRSCGSRLETQPDSLGRRSRRSPTTRSK
jgi:hypothetical protein